MHNKIGVFTVNETDLCVIRVDGSIGDDTSRFCEDPARLVARRCGRGAQHSQASPAEDY